MLHMCRDLDGKVTPEEVAGAALFLKDTLGKQGVEELISSLSKDRGKPESFSICGTVSVTLCYIMYNAFW